MLKTQEGMDFRLEQIDEELRQLRSQSQVDGAQLAALSLQMQELISSVESRAKVVGRDLEEINGWFDHHRGVRKLDLSHLCFSLNFSFSYVLCNFLLCFPLLTYSQSFFSLSADYPRHSRQRRSKI